MKAILLIDVPDNTEFDKDYRLTGLLLANEYAENVGIEFKDARLKPVPRKSDETSDKISDYDYETAFNDGWNMCISEILGAEDEI